MKRYLLFPLLAAAIGCGKGPAPITAIFMLDTSLSSASSRRAIAGSVEELSKELQRSLDHVEIYRLNDRVNNLYSGEPLRRKDLKTLLDAYIDSPQDHTGTAYGTALLRGLEEAKLVSKRGERVALFVLGDGADEPVREGRNLDDGVLSLVGKEFPGVLSFMYVDPRYGDRLYARLHPLLGSRFQMLPAALASNKQSLRDAFRLLGR